MSEQSAYNENYSFDMINPESVQQAKPEGALSGPSAGGITNAPERADMSGSYRVFLKYLPTGGRILDFGCGTGRDTKYFMDQGFAVTAIDDSDEMCRQTESFTGINVRHMSFLDLNDSEIYAGIWASSVLSRVPKKDLLRMFAKLRKALNKDGILCVSFPEGTSGGMKYARYDGDLTEGELFNLINTVGGLKISEVKRITEERYAEKRTWICAIIKKW